jgi:ankyrin repeat protein
MEKCKIKFKLTKSPSKSYFIFIIQVLQILLTAGADVNIRDARGATALHRAASQGRSPIVNVLIAVPGIDISLADLDGNTPL